MINQAKKPAKNGQTSRPRKLRRNQERDRPRKPPRNLRAVRRRKPPRRAANAAKVNSPIIRAAVCTAAFLLLKQRRPFGRHIGRAELCCPDGAPTFLGSAVAVAHRPATQNTLAWPIAHVEA